VPKTLTGTLTGFGANEFVVIKVEDTRLASVQTDASGAARSFPITLPSSFATGGSPDMTLFAEGQTSGTQKTAIYHRDSP
jgi:hypothetical protein